MTLFWAAQLLLAVAAVGAQSAVPTLSRRNLAVLDASAGTVWPKGVGSFERASSPRAPVGSRCIAAYDENYLARFPAQAFPPCAAALILRSS